jgi:hypothetical protein
MTIFPIRGATGAALLCTVLVAGAAAAQETPPAPGTPRNIELPTARTFTLDNGMDVSIVPFGTVPKVDMHLVVRVGNVNEAAPSSVPLVTDDISITMLSEPSISLSSWPVIVMPLLVPLEMTMLPAPL